MTLFEYIYETKMAAFAIDLRDRIVREQEEAMFKAYERRMK